MMKLEGFLIAQGYKQPSSDHSLFILHKESSFIALLVYVDDVILAENSIYEIDRIKTILNVELKLKISAS